jgi:hypothetical protein
MSGVVMAAPGREEPDDPGACWRPGYVFERCLVREISALAGKVFECGVLPGLHLATLARRAAGLISCPDHAHQRVLNLGTCSAKLVLILYGHADRTRIDGACPACAA